MGTRSLGMLAAALLLLTACSDGESPDAAGEATPPSATVTEATDEPATEPVATPELDSVAVIGHSGATGTMSDPDNPFNNAYENSWATGDNPEVRSIYHRLLATHPALEGHNYNAAVNGSRVSDLPGQVEDLVESVEVVPDLVLIQSIDNDMRCDGTDDENYRPFARTLDRAMTQLEREFPGVRTFFVSQWADAATWAAWAQHVPLHVADYSGTGPCDVFDGKGRPRRAGIVGTQRISEGYWAEIERVCARHAGCATDGFAENREFIPVDEDLSVDMNHLSVAGHAKYAAIAWKALPKEIKDAP
jgi:hypothetical protein